MGTFLYCNGVDNSSSSAVAAHLNQLANTISLQPQAWFGKYKPFKVTKAVYASYDVFSKSDVIVACHLPGAVSTLIDSHGQNVQESEDIWLGVFVSGIMRSLISGDDEQEQVHGVVECRTLNPFQTKDAAKYFFQGFERFFFQGQETGYASEIQTPTVVKNYLVDAFLKVIELTGMFDEALAILERLRTREEAVVSIIVKVLFRKDQEVKAIRALHGGLQENPRDSELLLIQSQFLTRKGKPQLALQSAISAVNACPSEFYYWSNLSKVYLELGDIEQSLFTLNSCPMSAYREKSHQKRAIQARHDHIHLPQPLDVIIPDVKALDTAQVAEEHRSIDQQLANLPAANLKSTLGKAYDILTEIVHRTGWESLLKYRARIFVMEEEYRSKSSSQTNVAENETTNSEDGFKQKRLCERWLDNLFMILYDDLKTYTMWQAEAIHFQAQQTVYEKLPLEWEFLGMCAFRLHHYKEAAIAFQMALESRFTAVCTRNLLKFYLMETHILKNKTIKVQLLNGNGTGNANGSSMETPQQLERKLTNLDDHIISLVVRLTAWNHRWYCEFAPYLINALGSVVERQGLIKVTNEISVEFPEDSGVNAMMEESLKFFKVFNKAGATA